MNKYHRYINLPFELERPPEAYGTLDSPRHQDLPEWRPPEVVEWLENLGLILGHVEIFYTPAGGELPIHTDELYLSNQIKFNTTWGPEDGKIIWWEGDKKKVEPLVTKGNYLDADDAEAFAEESVQILEGGENGAVVIQLGAVVVLPKKEDCVKVFEASTNRTSMVNVGQLHSTSSPKESGRWTLCFVPHRYNPRTMESDYIQWDEALEIFDDYLEKGSK